MRDEASDRKSNKKTIAVLLGTQKVKLYHLSLIFIAFLASLSYAILQWEYTKAWGLVPLVAFLPLFKNMQVVWVNKSPGLLDSELKKVALSTFAYSILFFLTQALV